MIKNNIGILHLSVYLQRELNSVQDYLFRTSKPAIIPKTHEFTCFNAYANHPMNLYIKNIENGYQA